MANNDPVDDLARQLNAVFEPFRKAMTEMAAAWSRGFEEWKQTPAGQYMLAVAKYYDEHPEELVRLREANRPREYCNCLCQRWNHLGDCQTYATTTQIMYGLGYPLDVAMCGPCAASIGAQRALA